MAGAFILLAFFDLKSRREEAWLVKRFPEYAAYQRRTRRLIPWLY
jgi:protein-S-isoprenylcysteine O-methyltransferase Ste14